MLYIHCFDHPQNAANIAYQPICKSLPDLHQPHPAEPGAAPVAAAEAGKPDTPGNHPGAVPALAAAAEAAERCVRASVVAVASRRLSDSPRTFAALGCSSLASAAAAAVAGAAARTGRTHQRQQAFLMSGGCRPATRSRPCRVLAGCPSLGCVCCEGGFGLESRRRVEVHWGLQDTALRRLVGVLACGRRRIVVVLAIGRGRLRG